MLDTDPHVAHGVVQQVVDLFLELASGSDRRQMENARAFLLQQLAAYEQQLREAERRRAEFTTRYQDLLAVNGSVSRLDAVRTRIEAMRGELSDDDQPPRPAAAADRHLARVPALIAGAASSTVEAEQRLMVLRQRYTEQHPEVAAARAGARGCPRSGRHQPQRRRHDARPTSMREQLSVRIVDTDSQIASLERQLRDLETQHSRLEEMARNAPRSTGAIRQSRSRLQHHPPQLRGTAGSPRVS